MGKQMIIHEIPLIGQVNFVFIIEEKQLIINLFY